MKTKMKFCTMLFLPFCVAITLTGCGGSTTLVPAAINQSPVVTGLIAQPVSGNTVNLIATATDDTGVTGYCFKTVNTTPLVSDACFQTAAQKNAVALLPGVTHYVWAKDAVGSVSISFKGPCSIAGYAASDLSSKNTVCMQTDKGEIVLELDAVKAPVTVANFLQYVNDGFYSGITFHRVISTFMIQGGGYTYSTTSSYQPKTPTAAIVLEKTTTTGLSNLTGTIAMARTDLPNTATSQFYINVVNNLFLDATGTSDGYAVFGKVISGLSVVDQIKVVTTEVGSAGADQPVTPVLIQWVYQLK